MKKNKLKPIERNTRKANIIKFLARLGKLPLISWIYEKIAYPEGSETQTGTPIPVNISLGTYEDQILHYKVTEYFIKKAGTIVLMDCPCRISNKCENHDVSLGCTWLGKGAAKMNLSKFPGARIVTKEEALEREQLAYENGLVPHLGKLREDARRYHVLDYEHEFMSICHCCSCCCIVSLMKYGPEILNQIVKRMEGVEVRVNSERCVGCGTCFEVCIYNGLQMTNNKTNINPTNCKGCGRCERICPQDAIAVTIDDYSRIDELVARFEKRVDISG